MGYFVDTYAIIEFFRGNKKFAKYFKGNPILTILNLMEFYYRVLREFGKRQANIEYGRFVTHVVNFNDEMIKEAMEFRLKMHKKGKDFSYTDSIGYIVARKNEVIFLTGDKEFKGLKNVKFVK